MLVLALITGCSPKEPTESRSPEPQQAMPPSPPAVPQPSVTTSKPTYTNDPASFHGILWGTPVALVSGLEEVSAAATSDAVGEWKCYTRKFDDLQFGAAVLEEIRYYFLNGKLHSVMLRTVPGQFESLKHELMDRHGTGTAKPGFADQLWWGFSREDATNERLATIHLSKSFEDTGYARFTAIADEGVYAYDRVRAGEPAATTTRSH